MDALIRKRLTLPLAPLGAGILAIGVALLFALLPSELLGNLVLDSGIATLVPAAEPPLGVTARAALVLIGGGGIGLVAWFALFLLLGTRSIAISGRGTQSHDLPVLRRADAHPDAPARRPLFATQDLGTPFLDVRAPVHIVAEELPAPIERALPVDLDLPMSAYDPQAIPEAPMERASIEVASLPAAPGPRPQVFEDGERFETFELTPMVRTAMPAAIEAVAAPASPIVPDQAASIHSLLDRLEKGVTRRAPPSAAQHSTHRESLQDSLASLRRLATTR